MFGITVCRAPSGAASRDWGHSFPQPTGPTMFPAIWVWNRLTVVLCCHVPSFALSTHPGFVKTCFRPCSLLLPLIYTKIAVWNLDVFPAAWKASILNLEEFGPSFPPGRLLPFNFEHIESGSCSSLPETPHIFLPSIFFFNPVICLSAHLQEKAFISEMPLFKLRLTKAVFRPCFSERVW